MPKLIAIPLLLRLLLLVQLLLIFGMLSRVQAQQPIAPDTVDLPVLRVPLSYPAGSAQAVFDRRLPPFTGHPSFRQMVVPVALLTFAVLGTEKVDVLETDEALRAVVHKHVRIRTSIDDQLRHVPGYASLGLSALGIKGQHSTLNQALLFGLTYTINNTFTSNLKRMTSVTRPRGNSFDSFPSAHTSAAFSSATLLHKEYGSRSGWYSVAGYTVATATGALRVAKDNHWLSDVMAGAGVGVLSTELAYWIYPWLHRQLVRGLGERMVIMPVYLDGTVGATAVMIF